jgi:hypothetical protein
MAMQHHYPATHFSPYHPLPPASVAAAAFGQPPNAGMIAGGQPGGGLNGQGGFVGNPLQGVHANTILPRYSLSHPASGNNLAVLQGVNFNAVGRVEIFKTLVHRACKKKNTFNEIFVGFFCCFYVKMAST